MEAKGLWQELEVSPRSGLYLLVHFICHLKPKKGATKLMIQIMAYLFILQCWPSSSIASAATILVRTRASFLVLETND